MQPVKSTAGEFFGRIWVETQNGNVVRYNGDLAGSEKDYHEFFHFDSWRTNVQPNLWLPTSFYVEESDPKSQTSTLKFKAINHVWGYVLKVPVAVRRKYFGRGCGVDRRFTGCAGCKPAGSAACILEAG